MTISTANPEAAGHGAARRRRAGFSVVELLIAMTISSVALAAVLSTVTFVARSAISTTDYADMDREARSGLEIFARDVRMAQDLDENLSTTSVTLDVVTESGFTQVPYTFVPATRTFYRFYGVSGRERALITNIDPATFKLTYYSIATDASGQPREAVNRFETKQIQLELRSVRSGPAKAFATNNVVSARYILRNKDAH